MPVKAEAEKGPASSGDTESFSGSKRAGRDKNPEVKSSEQGMPGS